MAIEIVSFPIENGDFPTGKHTKSYGKYPLNNI